MFFTIVCVIGLTNAINFIDGIDGLSSSVSIIAIFSILFYSYYENDLGNHLLLFYLLISIFIFLFSNLNIILPKSFLGDSGSMFLGFFIAWLLIYFTHPSINYFHPVLCIWVASLPIFDLMTVFLSLEVTTCLTSLSVVKCCLKSQSYPPFMSSSFRVLFSCPT